MSKGFNKSAFMAYLEKEFYGFDNSFFRDTVENLIDYALTHKHHSLDQACYFLSDMLPEVAFGDVAMFMDDSMLTYHGREVKKEALEEYQDLDGKQTAGFESLESLVSAASELQQAELSATLAQIDHVFGAIPEAFAPEI